MSTPEKATVIGLVFVFLLSFAAVSWISKPVCDSRPHKERITLCQ